jgi:hypothetical protein
MLMARTPQWILERDVGASFFRIRRTSVEDQDADAMKKTADMVARALGSIDRSHHGLLVDLREGPMRNDQEFEASARPYQLAIMASFGRIAVLVKTPAGRLQIERLMGAAANRRVFSDEAAAVAFLNSR